MEQEIFEILTRVQNREQSIGDAQSRLLLLFGVSGSCQHDFVWLKPDEDDSLDRKCEKCGFIG